CIASEKDADETLRSALSGKEISPLKLSGFLGNMFVYSGALYKKYDIIMQIHMAVKRNASTYLFKTCGADCGGDCVSDEIPAKDVISVLDNIEQAGGLPQTVLYNLNASMAHKLSTICGSFRNVRLGTAWWFCDNKSGIEEQIRTICETGHIGSFLGMLTDSRSFLSYARHDYFRRIFCSCIGELTDAGEYAPECADALVKKVFYENIAELLEVKK
ncbi:MAG: glucuronate isomerase, partial [Clostridia bacterium]|nr:glucuronate isomerase [Clostridia bacterium]